MDLPKQVAAAEARSNAIIADHIKARDEASAASAAKQDDAPKVDQQQEQAETPKPAATKTQDAEYWKARHDTLQGKYNAEVPRLAAEKAGLAEKVKQLETENDELRNSAKDAGKSGDPSTIPGVTKDDLDRFDPDVIDLARRVAQATIKTEIDPIRSAVAESAAEREAVKTATRETEARDEFLEAVTELVPDWQKFDQSKAFHTYMAEVDPAAGVQRQELLKQAIGRYDSTAVARLFLAFKRSNPQKEPIGDNDPAKRGLESQIVPDLAGSAKSGAAAGKRTYTRAEVREAYSNISKLALKNPARAKEIEQELDLAIQEGRIV